MMKKLNKKGFTMAELLIVVAIIAVLVAIAIPIFTTQLEKSRDAVDLANVRAAYAELSSALVGETTSELDSTVWTSGTGTYTYTYAGKGKTAGWSSGTDGKVGGIAVTNAAECSSVEFTVSGGKITAIAMQ